MAAKELLEYIMEQLSGLEEIRSIPMSCPTNEQLIAIRKLNTLTSNIV